MRNGQTPERKICVTNRVSGKPCRFAPFTNPSINSRVLDVVAVPSLKAFFHSARPIWRCGRGERRPDPASDRHQPHRLDPSHPRRPAASTGARRRTSPAGVIRRRPDRLSQFQPVPSQAEALAEFDSSLLFGVQSISEVLHAVGAEIQAASVLHPSAAHGISPFCRSGPG
jgi:hypothetical protein